MSRSRGFTLVEILIVIVIVGLLAGIAVLAIGNDPQRQLRQEAQRALAVLQMAADEAMLEGREYGLVIDPQGYQVVEFNEQQRHWQASSTDAFARHRLPDHILIRLDSEGTKIDLGKLASSKPEQKQPSTSELTPALLLLSSGEVTPFSLSIEADNLTQGYTLHSDGFAAIALERGHEP